jgi:hypothetical protein
MNIFYSIPMPQILLAFKFHPEIEQLLKFRQRRFNCLLSPPPPDISARHNPNAECQLLPPPPPLLCRHSAVMFLATTINPLMFDSSHKNKDTFWLISLAVTRIMWRRMVEL